MTGKVTKAIFPVAGLGTRFLPATKSVPKEIMTLVDRPLVQYAIDEARAAGIEEFIFVTARGKSALEDYFDQRPYLEEELRKKGKTKLLEALETTNMESGAVAYIRQSQALGLGHAVWCARWKCHLKKYRLTGSWMWIRTWDRSCPSRAWWKNQPPGPNHPIWR